MDSRLSTMTLEEQEALNNALSERKIREEKIKIRKKQIETVINSCFVYLIVIFLIN